jgi:hypothetical protein
VADKGSCPDIPLDYHYLKSLSKDELLARYVAMDREHRQNIADLRGAIDVLSDASDAVEVLSTLR